MNIIASEARFRQRVLKYSFKHGVTAASIRFHTLSFCIVLNLSEAKKYNIETNYKKSTPKRQKTQKYFREIKI